VASLDRIWANLTCLRTIRPTTLRVQSIRPTRAASMGKPMPDEDRDDEYEDEHDDEHDDEEGSRECPYCRSEETCPHLLLTVDKTFRTAEGGVLMDAFNARWNVLVDKGGQRFDEYSAFVELLERVASLSDAETEHRHDGPPGMSSAYLSFYAGSDGKMKAAVRRFTPKKSGG